MTKFLQKDKNKRQFIKKFETRRFILKSIIKNINYSNMVRWNAVLLMATFPIKSSEIHVINRCILTGNKKRVNNLYSYSRMVFLKLVRSGCISGMKKATW